MERFTVISIRCKMQVLALEMCLLYNFQNVFGIWHMAFCSDARKMDILALLFCVYGCMCMKVAKCIRLQDLSVKL